MERSLLGLTMRKYTSSIAVLTPMVAVATGLVPDAQASELSDLRVRQLYTDLQASVCQNDWDSALAVIQPLIGSPSVSPSYQEHLVYFRDQLEDWRATHARFSNIPNCGGAIATQYPGSFASASGVASASTRNARIQELHAELQSAVCQSDWNTALSVIGPLMGSSGLSSTYRERLVVLRHQLQDWRAAASTLETQVACQTIASVPQPNTSDRPSVSAGWINQPLSSIAVQTTPATTAPSPWF